MLRVHLRAAASTLGLAAALIAVPAAAHATSAHRYGPAVHPVAAHATGYNQNGYNWSGYVVQGGSFSSVSAGWTEPSVTCNSSNDLFAPWVGIDGYGSSTVEQTGVETDCSSGRPVYRAWYEMYPAQPVYYSNPVSAGDRFTAKVTRSGNTYTLTIKDVTQGWSKVTRKTLSARNLSAEIIMESPTGAYPNFGTVRFTNARVDGSPLASYSRLALDASNNGGYENRTSAISGGGNFSITYLRE